MKTSLTIACVLSLGLGAAPLGAQTPKPRQPTVRADMAEEAYVSAMKKDLRAMATAEEAYFVDHAAYYSGPVNTTNPLYGFTPSPGVTINVAAAGGAAMWTAVASHARTPTKCTYQLPAPIECLSPAPPSPAASVSDGAAAPNAGSGAEPSTDSVSANANVITIGDPKPVAIRPGQSRLWGFEIGSLSNTCLAMGQIETLSGGDRNINVVIVRESEYKNWAENRPARTEYESGERTVVAFDVNINDAGRYIMVVSNSSRAASKVVQLQHVTVTCVQ
jgi:hypothetical protein